ncbi:MULTISPECIES: hypothetical protein [unclassified Corallococcus]|uniref:hypothetical protein n=1 Tax=unclassified Corallococcus TaxID=2685029 RepID=UPI001A8E99AD|nr:MULTISPECIES: hypothetical protein [unclassified Corallococcus]MBN9686391.1 hypothetical protein [Corallococcus sp. NCSPR001]WAS82182.1 hypothetical protein O0N60_22955 [Corallococcus sp. NCRR]
MFRISSVCLCLFASLAIADESSSKPQRLTVAQKNGWATYDAELKKREDAVNKACGSALKSSYERTSYPAFDPMKDRTQSACQMAVGTLVEVCGTADGKAAVKEAVKKTVCRLSTEGTKTSLDGGVLTIYIDPENTSITGKESGSYSWKSAYEEIL